MFKLLVFRNHEVIGEYSFRTNLKTDDAVREVFAKLKPELSAVVLGSHGVIAVSANLPASNVWNNPFVAHL